MKRQKYFFANWKLYFSFSQMQQFVKKHRKDLIDLADLSGIEVGIAAGHEQLYFLGQKFKNSCVKIGSQNSSTFFSGAHTGEVSVSSLADLNIHFGLVGHSEVRLQQADTNDRVAAKVKLLIASGITPIICVGESLQQKEENMTFQVLYDQLEQIFDVLKSYSSSKVFIAYEPLYAIGSGTPASKEDVSKVFGFLKRLTEESEFAKNVMFLYGGSVTSKTVHDFNDIVELDGFLIGSASRDFQELKKIVLSDYKVLEKNQLEQLQMRD